MRAMSFAALALVAPLAIARAQTIPTEINHRSPLAIGMVLDARQSLNLDESQVQQLERLRTELTGGPVAPMHQVQTVRVYPRFPGRVPGKLSAPRLERRAETLPVHQPCPFSMLNQEQMRRVHRLLVHSQFHNPGS